MQSQIRKKLNKSKQISIISILILLLLLSLTGCVNSGVNGSDVVDIGDMATSMEDRLAEKRETIRKESKEDFLREYAEERYLKDYSEINEKLTELYKEKIVKELKEIGEDKSFVVGDINFFNDSLDKLEKGEITENEILENTLETAKDCDLSIYVFSKDLEKKTSKYQYFFKLYNKFKINSARSPKFVMKLFTKKALVFRSIDELKNDVNRDVYLREKEYKMVIENFDKTFSRINYYNTSNKDITTFKEIENHLKEKYGEEFVYLKPLEAVSSWKHYLAPKKDVSKGFSIDMSGYPKDTYLYVLAQSMIDKKVEAILEKYDVQGKIVAYSSTSRGLDYTKYNTTQVYNLSDLFNDESYLKEDVTLYYLKAKDEEIDEELLFKVIKEIQNIFPNLEDRAEYIWVMFYEMSEMDRIVTAKLFKDKPMTAGILPEQRSFSKLETMDDVDAEIECFNFMYTFGEKLDFILGINDKLEENERMTYFEDNTTKGLWN